MNSVFWLKSATPQAGGKIRIRNWHDVGREVEEREALIEDALVYPLLRGRDVHRWRVAAPSTHILVTQDPETRVGIAERTMKQSLPRTYEYLRHFEDLLRGRPGYRKYFDPDNDPFWTVYNVGRYSMAPYRVLFKELTNRFQSAAYVANGKPAIADTKLRFVECPTADHAYFLSGLLNSSPAGLYLFATATSVQTADYQASDISRLNIPPFDPTDAVHAEIARISKACHEAASRAIGQLHALDRQLDEACATLWDLTAEEMAKVRGALDEFGIMSSPVDEEDETTSNEIGDEEHDTRE
jgi:hypothetical protein